MTGPVERIDDSAIAATRDADPMEGQGTEWPGHHPHGAGDDPDVEDVPPRAAEAYADTEHVVEDVPELRP
ncbi:MAG TPA: hypothetical protein VGO94_01290 [Mycobacteriales bacterium]|nr:hypothetical protein [Mycobacteriales bacterium]